MKLLPPGKVSKPPRGYQQTNLIGYAKAVVEKKDTMFHGHVWVPTEEKNRPEELPLQFGTRQGREYFWHFERGIISKDEWLLGGDGRILRIMPPGNEQQAQFFLTLTFTRQAPPPVDELSTDRLIGIDRGEKIPAAYAMIDSNGKSLFNKSRYREFNESMTRWSEAFDKWKKGASGQLPSFDWNPEPGDGFGVICPEYLAQQEAFNALKRKLQQTKGGYTNSLRSKERNRAKALGGEVTRHLLHLSAEHKAPLVLENLGSGIVTRGGKGIIMSRMQYERILVALEQRLSETGLYDLPSQPKFRKQSNRFLKLAGPAYTSSTCSDCGQVHSTGFYEKIASTLCFSEDSWSVTLPDGSARKLPEKYEYFVRGKGWAEKTVDGRIREIFGSKTLETLSATARSRLVTHLRAYWIPYRPTQAQFQCLACGHQANADLQASLNIARKFLFKQETKSKSKEDSEKARRTEMSKWEKWYREKVESEWA
ncbi:MAG: hypothetical protein HN531_10615 [Opitutae bacterium]|nr:hypothetical protein [Opitutae bacterium]